MGGTVTLLSGDCMPPAPPTCAQAEVIGAGDIFFLDIVTGKGFAAWWEEGTYQVLLPDGEYYVWPDIGWGAGIVAPACWLDLAQCSPGDLAFVQGEFDYMAGQAKCTQDALWDSHDRCNVVIAGCTIQLDIQIDNVAY
jgi:hypothetical protein